MEKKQKTKIWKRIFGFGALTLLSGIGGFFLAKYMAEDLKVKMNPILSFFLLMAALYLQIIFHEAGHLLFGLLGGYRFSSFRIGSLMVLKNSSGFHFKRFTLAGTGGQCLMLPPACREDGMIPVILYNLGGPLMNLITAGLFFLLIKFCNLPQTLIVFYFLLGFTGLILGLMNGIPIHSSTIDNDGMNAISLRKDYKANRAMRIQLEINGQCSEGKRLRDMDSSWFEVPSDREMENPMVCTLGVFAENRLMDQGRFSEAMELIHRLLGLQKGLIGIYRYHLICDLICCKLLLEEGRGVDELLTKDQKQYMKQMKNFPMILRTQYFLAVLKNRDFTEAEKIRKHFDKIGKSYPYPGDIASEMEIMLLADQK